MITLLKIISLFVIILVYRCATTNNSHIATKVKQTDKTYVYSSKSSKHYLSKIRNIIETEYPSFSDDNFQIHNPEVIITWTNNKKFEIIYQRLDHKNEDFDKVLRITQKIEELQK